MHINNNLEATTVNEEDLENNNTEACKSSSSSSSNNADTPSSDSMVRKKSDLVVVTNNVVRFQMVRLFMKNFKEVLLGTKLVVLFPAVPLAVAAHFYNIGRVS